MGMHTHLMLNVPLINDKKDGAKFIEDNQEAVKKNTGHGAHGLSWHTAQALFQQINDNVFLNQSEVHYSEYGDVNPTMNHTVILTMDVKIKNYDHEIEKFLKVLTPYIEGDYCGDKPLFLGTTQYEEDFMPKLIFFDNTTQTVVFKTIKYTKL